MAKVGVELGDGGGREQGTWQWRSRGETLGCRGKLSFGFSPVQGGRKATAAMAVGL
jgi:hypothetical protein